jgi:hypothetical protein
VIVPVRAQALRWEDASGVHYAKRVNHPGTKANPVVRRNVDRAKQPYLNALKREMRDE